MTSRQASVSQGQPHDQASEAWNDVSDLQVHGIAWVILSAQAWPVVSEESSLTLPPASAASSSL